MNKKYVIIFTVILLLALGLWFLQKTRLQEVISAEPPPISAESATDAALRLEQGPRLLELSQAPASPKVIANVLRAKTGSSVCRAQTELLITKTSAEVVDLFRQGQKPLTNECWAPIDGGSLQACTLLVDQPKAMALAKACGVYLTQVRAVQIFQNIDVATIPSEISTSELSNQVLAIVSSGQEWATEKSGQKRKALRSLSTELRKRLPESLQAHKAVLASFIYERPAKTYAKNPELKRQLAEALQSFPKDEELHLVQLNILRHEASSLDHIKKFAELNPQSSVGQFYLAGEYFRTGNRPAAIEAMQQAAVLSPLNPSYKEITGRLQAKPHQISAETFVLPVTFGF